MARAKSFGIEFEFISPAEAGSDRADPAHRRPRRRGVDSRRRQGESDRPHAVARQGRAHARRDDRRRRQGRPASTRRDGRVAGVALASGRRRQATIACETLVNCAGQWAREFGRLAGVNVPLYSAEHFYIVTKPIAGVTPDCR